VDRPPTEQELLERARGGDPDAYGQLMRAHQEVAFRTAFLITSNAADAEEAAQEAFFKAYRALGRLRRGEPLRPWLLTIVANEARNRRRAARRRQRLAQTVAVHERDATLAAAPSAAATVLSAERRELLLSALGALREEDRQVIACRHLLELSERESAAVLGCRPGTVKSRLSRALVRLRVQLREEIDDDD
jgi:RNA polymerase sigma factor (sigma-70 family)